MKCGKLIWLHSSKVNTYCMRDADHAGDCFIQNREPTKEELKAMKAEYSDGQNNK